MPKIHYPANIYRHELCNIYGDCEIREGTKVGAFVEIGPKVIVGKRCKIQAFSFIPEGVIIGDDVFIGPRVTFCNVKHPMRGEQYLQTIVHDKAIIGAGAVVLPGVIIGESAIIGAGSVVTKSVKPGVTVFGNPAKPFRRRVEMSLQDGLSEKVKVDKDTDLGMSRKNPNQVPTKPKGQSVKVGGKTITIK